MISGLNSQGVRVPGGFATTAKAFESFLDHSDLKNKINELLNYNAPRPNRRNH